MQKKSGFTLIELMIVVAIIAIIAAIAIPGLLRARIASNETAAIGTLRTLSTSEAQFQSASVVDQDGDGTGEFGWMQELGGATGTRLLGGGLSANPASPTFITSVLGTTAQTNNGIAGKSGFSFLIYLPIDNPGPAAAEIVPIPAAFTPSEANQQEVRFACYAWPASLGNSGNRAFIVSQQGEVFSTANKDFQNYNGTTAGVSEPPPGAAFTQTPGSTEEIDNLEGQLITGGTLCGDGGPWLPAGN